MLEMTSAEKKRLIHAFESLHTGQVNDLPPYIVNSASEGMNSLVDKLIKTDFLNRNDWMRLLSFYSNKTFNFI